MSRTRIDLLLSLCILLLVAWAVWEAQDWPFRTRLFPLAVGFPVLALALVQLGLAAREALKPTAKAAGDGGAVAETSPPTSVAGERAEVVRDPRIVRARALVIMAWTVGFALGFWLFGFKVGALLLSLGFLRFQAKESWKTSLLFGLGIYLSFLVGFQLVLGVPLPAGLIATSLGLESLDAFLVNPLREALSPR